jgi:hypothetical protein
VRFGSDQVVHDLTAAAFDFDVLTGPQAVLLDFLEQATAPAAADLDPANLGRVTLRDLARREHASSKCQVHLTSMSVQERA